MIDTDKYEGHTEGPWTLYSTASGGPTIAGKLNDVDWQLIADAPLLLAEVKRLRVRYSHHHQYVSNFYAWMVENHIGLVKKWEGEEE